MKEKYLPTEPIKKGIEVASFAGKAVFEAVKPVVKRRMARTASELLELLGWGE
jgi:hypothetical protein